MKKEVIYTEHYALIISDEKAVEGDVMFCTEIKNIMIGGITSGQLRYLDSEIFKKIIAHRPLTDVPNLKGVPLLPDFSQEDDVEDLALAYSSSKGNVNPEGYSDKQVGLLHGFIDGYNKSKETYKYTEEDLRNAFYNGWLYRGEKQYQYPKALNEFTQSLQQPERPKYFECEMEDGLINQQTELNNWGERQIVKINSQGQIELIGKYIY
jgi:hypothetical protein